VKTAKLLWPAAVLSLQTITASAQPDYAPAIWSPAYSGHWYTTGKGHKFVVIHDMEGYYLDTISYFKLANQGTGQASIHYCVNGLKNGSDEDGHNENRANDRPAGEITQMVREQYYAWHARCWNQWSFGTEHEGFVSSPAWYTEAQYQASALLQRHLCENWAIAKDRNHIIGHNEHLNPAWRSWATNNLPGLDPTCNTHTDPGQYWNWAHFMNLITNGAPAIASQPLNRSVDQGTNVSFKAVVGGDASLKYQWRKNGAGIAGASTSVYTIANVQAAHAGDYSVVITNLVGAVTSVVATLTVNLPQIWQVSYLDNFDTNSSANWNLFQGSGNNVSDYTATWAFDYGAVQYVANGVTNVIPAAPDSGGTTRGLKLTVNKNDTNAATAGVSLYPKNQSYSNNYALRFDMWINYNGDAGGGSGSTEFGTFGLNHSGTRVNWAPINSTSSDGLWFAVDGEGGSGAADFRAYQGKGAAAPTQLAFASAGLTANGAFNDSFNDPFFMALFPPPAYETGGVPGKHWVQGELSQINGVISWRLNGVVVAQRTNTTSYTSGNIMIGYMDVFTSIANPPEDNFIIFDNVRVLTPVIPPVIAVQPASRTVNAGANTTFGLTVTGTAPLAYQWRFNNSSIAGATGSTYSRTNLQAANAGNYSVTITNAAGSATSSSAVLTVTQLKLTSLVATNGSWKMTINGAPGSGYGIETSTNLLNWVLLQTLVNTNGTLEYFDSVHTNDLQRYYRVTAPQ
jgi:N-acetyl-anhydromuramyl-L-alanine amidase AmpD